VTRRPLALLACAVVVFLAVTSIDAPATRAPGPFRPGLLGQVYRHAAADVTAPVGWAKDAVVQRGLATWLDTLPLDETVRARVKARVASDALVDEVVPFLLFLKSMYDQHRAGVVGFDATLRARADHPPAWETALFRWEPAPEHGLSLPDAEVLARLVTLYDAVWLRDVPADASLSTTLHCGDEDVEVRASAVAPVVRDLLASLGQALTGDAKLAVDRVRNDDAVLHTVSVSLIDFVDQEACKHYRVFAREQARVSDLETFLLSGDPAVWDYLVWAQTRPRAVHFIVDGLQGSLVKALARGDARFFADLPSSVPRPANARPAPPMEESCGPRWKQFSPAAVWPARESPRHRRSRSATCPW
jgi:hypothetical protein